MIDHGLELRSCPVFTYLWLLDEGKGTPFLFCLLSIVLVLPAFTVSNHLSKVVLRQGKLDLADLLAQIHVVQVVRHKYVCAFSRLDRPHQVSALVEARVPT